MMKPIRLDKLTYVRVGWSRINYIDRDGSKTDWPYLAPIWNYFKLGEEKPHEVTMFGKLLWTSLS